MDWPTDTLAGVYLCLFAFGLLFSFISLLLGAAHGHLHVPGGEHAGLHGHGGHVAADAPDPRAGAPAPLNLSTVLMFLTWFGGVGYLLRAYYAAPTGVSLLAATALGLVGAALVYLFLAKVLWRWQTELDPANYALAGTLARVSSPIRASGTGEIVYTLDEKRRVDGARSLDGTAIPLGADVEIVRYEAGLAYVRPWADAAEAGPFRGRPIEPP